jgi:hypothetical protein
MKLPLRPLTIAAAAFGSALIAASAANAFTIDNESNTTASGAARYTDPDAQFSGLGSSNGRTVLHEGNTTLQFGAPQSFDQRYNPSRMFDPNGGPGRDGYR